MSDTDVDGEDLSASFLKYSKSLGSTRALIRLVKARGLLWDRAAPQYRDKPAKERAWREIFREFEPAFDDLSHTKKQLLGNMIMKKWNNVRDAYVKSRKPSHRQRPYIYSEEMQFLDAVLSRDCMASDGFMNMRTMKGYQESVGERGSTGDGHNDDSWVNQVFVDIDDGSSEPNLKRVKIEGNQNKEVPECDESIVSVLVNLIQKEEDEDRAFFKSITPAVKQLSQSSKFEFRIQVMKLINTLKLREKQPKYRKEKECTVSDTE